MPVCLTPLLSIFSPEHLGQLSRYGESIAFKAGANAIPQDVENHYLYLVLSGELSVIRSVEAGDDVEIAKIRAGGMIGEMSLFDPARTEVRVDAVIDTEAWRIGREGVDAYRDEYPDQAYHLLEELCRGLSHKLRETTMELVQSKF